MELFTFIGAALVALLVMVLPALAHKQHWNVIREGWRCPLRLALGVLQSELGTIFVTYYIRGGGIVINGSTTPPTAAQANQVMKQSAVVQFGSIADTQALFTHNWGLDNSAAGFYEPEIAWEPISSLPGNTGYAFVTFWRVNSNVVSVNKADAAQTATTGVVTLRRPHSMGQ